ncbi:MAG: N-acetyl-gamma-glutamyl-phosphate reductase [Oscillospiraceae bacterium]|nr:N-acetyl-gamma-glutamyl-phosphate reductase [Oscillospiraceae bacterium]
MAYKVFIDGQEGTTGLRIVDRLKDREDIQLMFIDEDLRKSTAERKRLINESDYTFLCLPDAAAIESASLVENPNTKILDASTAHRTNPAWVYGLPELSAEQRSKIAASKRVAVPGCYASGFNALVYPMVKSGLIAPYHPVFCHAVSGYSGAGKKTIAVYEGNEKPDEYNSPRQYSMGKQHKHIKEMMAVSGLSYPPIFNPIVDNYYNGMVVSVPFHLRAMPKRTSAKAVWEMLSEHYQGQNFVKVMNFMGEGDLADGFLAANTMKDTNMMQIFVFGNDDHILLCSRFDNLGKGASGAAVQCMNIMMGIDETTGLV